MTPEGKVKGQIKSVLQELKAYYFMPAANGYGKAGVPDFIGCYKGVFFGIEAKAGANTTTALQNRELRKIHDAGGFAVVVREEDLAGFREVFVQGCALRH